jgi:sarcosine oxidase
MFAVHRQRKTGGDLSDIFDVVVVGAGMFGAAAARHLSATGADLMVVGPAEPEDKATASQHAFGAYFGEARITRRLGWDEVWGVTDARSFERYHDIEVNSGIPFFHECGSLVVMAKSIARRTSAILEQCAAGCIQVERMQQARLRAEFPDFHAPALNGGAEGLFEQRHAGYLNPRELVRAQLALAQSNGARLLRSAVTAIGRDQVGGLWRLRTQANGNSDIRAKRVLVTTGAFTNHNGVLPDGRALALYPFTEPNLLFEVDDAQLASLRGLPTIVTVDPDDSGDANMSLYLLPPIKYPDGRWYLRIGPGMQPIVQQLHSVEEMVAWYSRQRISAAARQVLTTMMETIIPGLRPRSVHEAACIIEKTPSRYPYIGHLDDDETLTVAVGGNGHGARGSDEIGRLAATVTLGLPWDCPIPLETFAPIRAADVARRDGERPGFCKPPFGLC